MEKLKSLIPEDLLQIVKTSSSVDDLLLSSSSLLRLFQGLPEFHQAVGELSNPDLGFCGKNKETSLDLKHQGNISFRSHDFKHALRFYSKALRFAPPNATDGDKSLLACLFLNRANTLQNLGLLEESLRDCHRALRIDPYNVKALYRRDKLNTAIGIYKDDITIAKKELQNEQLPSVKLNCVWTKEKGRGMVSEADIEPGSIIHVEQPFSVVISKGCRETHCHFCLNELPFDVVPCTSCSVPVYCSEFCQIQSADVLYDSDTESVGEHQHECFGANWPAVLPSDAVLAGRVIMKLIKQEKTAMDLSNLEEILELSHSYSKMNPETKLELHLLSIVLICCLCQSCCPHLSVSQVSVTQTIILLSQIKVNSIAVVRIKSGNVSEKEPIQSLEQMRVGQALYKTASLFNHSCKPNIHLYFLSRRLVMRTTEFVPKGVPLELSYGPEVGKWDCKDRIRVLQEEYFFHCQCRCCSQLNLSDLVINGYCCVNTNCTGVVLDTDVAACESHKLNHNGDVGEVASSLLIKPRGSSHHIEPEICLKCGSRCVVKNSHAEVNKAWNQLRRLEGLMNSGRDNVCFLSDGLKSISVLRTFLHQYNKDIADAEDKVARACYLAGDLINARKHCQASIKILNKLYEEEHVVIGNEMVKLTSILLASGDSNGAWDITKRSAQIFSKYYGSHAEILYAHISSLKQEASKAVGN